MPYTDEPSSSTAHLEFMRESRVEAFLSQCEPILPDEDAQNEASKLLQPLLRVQSYRRYIFAADGSLYDSPVNDGFPSKRVGYIKIGAVVVDRNIISNLRDIETNLVDPEKVNSIQKGNQTWTLCLPLSNMKFKTHTSMRDTFRFVLDEFFCQTHESLTPLNDTLQYLSELRHCGKKGATYIHACPSCKEQHIYITKSGENCPHCKNPLYFSDCLRLWEEIQDLIPCGSTHQRLMTYLEHILPIHLLRAILPSTLGNLAIFIDNPLAIFGNGAWIHASLMQAYYNICTGDEKAPLIIGIQKSGGLADFATGIHTHIKPKHVLVPTDDFRYKYVGNEPTYNCFGYETYYGQDFIYFAENGSSLPFSLPYSCNAKTSAKFKDRFKLSSYPQLQEVVGLLEDLGTKLYSNSLIPIVLAHKYSSISLNPSGTLLDQLTRLHIKLP